MYISTDFNSLATKTGLPSCFDFSGFLRLSQAFSGFLRLSQAFSGLLRLSQFLSFSSFSVSHVSVASSSLVDLRQPIWHTALDNSSTRNATSRDDWVKTDIRKMILGGSCFSSLFSSTVSVFVSSTSSTSLAAHCDG